jgi:hypothetical protein
MTYTFNRCDIITVLKDEHDICVSGTNVIIRYEHVLGGHIYENKFDFADKSNGYIIDDYDMLCEYLTYLNKNNISPGFTKIFNESNQIHAMHITIPFSIDFRKQKLDMIFVLEKTSNIDRRSVRDLSCHMTQKDIIVPKNDDTLITSLGQKIFSLEKELKELKQTKYTYVFPYQTSVIKESNILTDSTKILYLVNQYVVPFCISQYGIINAGKFKITTYNGKSDSKSICMMLYDSTSKPIPIEKYGCNFICHYFLGEYNLIKIPTYKKINNILNKDKKKIFIEVIFNNFKPSFRFGHNKTQYTIFNQSKLSLCKNPKFLDNETILLDDLLIKFIDNYEILYCL